MCRHLTVVLILLLITACGRPTTVTQTSSPNVPDDREEKWNGPIITLPTEEGVVLPEGEFAISYPDPNEQEFLASYKGLKKAVGGYLLYAPGRIEMVDSLRSSFPRTSPLWQDTTDDWMDDRVVGRIALPGRLDTTYYLMFTEGGSGDPAFYLMTEPGGVRSGWEDADVMVLPDSGDALIYQRTNSVFPKRKRIHFANGTMKEVLVDRYSIGLQTIALTDFALRRALDDTAEVARVSARDSIEVVAGVDPPRSESVLLVRTRAGVEGWVRVPGNQCHLGVIKGICFLGD